MTAVDLRAPVIRTSKKDSASYRPEVEGMRAVASLLVAAFHIWLGRVSGGVDVFFVIAGFLTTFTLLGQVRRYGRIRPVRSWPDWPRGCSRRRPAVVVAVAAEPRAAAALQWSQTFTEALASAIYVENWQLYRAGVDYLTQDQFHSPVQNYWAMSVPGQFYLIWAILFGGLAVLVRLASSRPFPALLLDAGGLVDPVLRVRAVRRPPGSVERLLRHRCPGLGVRAGRPDGRPAPRPGDPPVVPLVAGWVGLAGIVSCGFVLQVSTEFPGVAALWPTLAVCRSWSPAPGRSAEGAERLLAGAALVWLGGRSYGLYLWH